MFDHHKGYTERRMNMKSLRKYWEQSEQMCEISLVYQSLGNLVCVMAVVNTGLWYCVPRPRTVIFLLLNGLSYR